MPKSYESLSANGTLFEAVSLETPDHFWAVCDSLEICGLEPTVVSTGEIDKFTECLKLFVKIGDEHAEQA